MRRQQRSGTPHADCVICCKQDEGTEAPVIHQVIEGLTYNRIDHTVKIHLLIAYSAARTLRRAVQFWVVHRSTVGATLLPFSWKPHDEQLKILNSLYSGRVVPHPVDRGSALFYRRVNCLGINPKPEILSLAGPGRCFAGTERAMTLEAAPEGVVGKRAFSAFLIPPTGHPAVEPGESGLFVLRLDLPRESYDHLITKEEQFSVDSWPRLKRDIETYDLGRLYPPERSFFEQHIKPCDRIIPPDAYDIVIFQRLGDPVCVRSGSLSIVPVRPAKASLAKEVRWFFGQPQEFYLELEYATKSADRKRGPLGFVVQQKVPADAISPEAVASTESQ